MSGQTRTRVTQEAVLAAIRHSPDGAVEEAVLEAAVRLGQSGKKIRPQGSGTRRKVVPLASRAAVVKAVDELVETGRLSREEGLLRLPTAGA